MRFTPKSEEELEAISILEPGIYPFLVTNATNEKSKSGNDMIKLTLTIWGKDGSTHSMFDYLLEAMAYKLRHFCSNLGLMMKYDRGELSAEDCINKSGSLELVIKEGKESANGGRYPSQNSVKDYVKNVGNANLSDNVADEDVPF